MAPLSNGPRPLADWVTRARVSEGAGSAVSVLTVVLLLLLLLLLLRVMTLGFSSPS